MSHEGDGAGAEGGDEGGYDEGTYQEGYQEADAYQSYYQVRAIVVVSVRASERVSRYSSCRYVHKRARDRQREFVRRYSSNLTRWPLMMHASGWTGSSSV